MKYIQTVEAMQYSKANLAELEKFANKSNFGFEGNQCFLKHTENEDIPLDEGDWLVKNVLGGIDVYIDEAFHKLFVKEVKNVVQESGSTGSKEGWLLGEGGR